VGLASGGALQKLITRSRVSLVVLVGALALASWLTSNGHGQLSVYAGDNWADFLKVILALPGPEVHSGPLNFIVQRYLESRDYKGPVGLDHLPPLSMLLSLILRWSFAFVSPVVEFFALCGLFMVSLALIVFFRTRDAFWAFAALVSYPALFILYRGNLYAGLCGLCLVAALLRRKPDWTAALLFAVALNIRPNAAPCVLPLLLLPDWKSFCFRLVLPTGAIFLISFAGANAIDPSYTLASFAGLGSYAKVLVAEGSGVAFGSSLYGAFYALGWRGHYLVPTALALLPLPFAMWAFVRRRMTYAAFVFVCVAVMAMFSTVFADYHLIAFIAPLLLADSFALALPSLLLLAPKGVAMIGPFTIQVVINPAVMFVASLSITLWSLRQAIPYRATIDPSTNPPALGNTSI